MTDAVAKVGRSRSASRSVHAVLLGASSIVLFAMVGVLALVAVWATESKLPVTEIFSATKFHDGTGRTRDTLRFLDTARQGQTVYVYREFCIDPGVTDDAAIEDFARLVERDWTNWADAIPARVYRYWQDTIVFNVLPEERAYQRGCFARSAAVMIPKELPPAVYQYVVVVEFFLNPLHHFLRGPRYEFDPVTITVTE